MRQRHPVRTILAACLLLAVAALPLLAQRPQDRRPLQVYINLGYVNLFSYPKWYNLGPELEVRFGRVFSINSDVSLWIGQSFGRKVKAVPGLTANVRIRRLIVGGGAVYRIADWPEDPLAPEVDRGWLMPKAQVGYMMGPTRLTFSLLFPGGADKVAAALTIAMGLGGGPSRD